MILSPVLCLGHSGLRSGVTEIWVGIPACVSLNLGLVTLLATVLYGVRLKANRTISKGSHNIQHNFHWNATHSNGSLDFRA